MSDTITNLVPLYTLSPGDTITYAGVEYVVLQHNRSRTKISQIANGKTYVLAMHAKVLHTGHDDEYLSVALEAHEDRRNERESQRPQLDLPRGTKVRFVDSPQTRKAGLVGVETVIVKINQKTYGLANEYRVTPGMIEPIE